MKMPLRDEYSATRHLPGRLLVLRTFLDLAQLPLSARHQNVY
jgi:hypothetical protein